MIRLLVFYLVLFLIVPAILHAQGVRNANLNPAALPTDVDVFDYNPADQTPPIPYTGVDDPSIFGTTYYDFTNYGSLSKMLTLDSQGGIQLLWTNGYDAAIADRHVHYNYLGAEGWAFDNGIAIWSSQRSGFANMDVASDGRAVACCHSTIGTETVTTVGIDFFYQLGAFTSYTVQNPFGYERCYWPHMAMDINDKCYVIGRLHGEEVVPAVDYTLFYYAESEDIVTSFTPEFTQYELADTMNVPSFTVATSRISDRAAIGYHQFLGNYLNYGLWSGFIYGQMNNDAYFIRKEVGEDWDWENPVNISKCIVGDVSYLPGDTLQAQGDTLRAYLDIELLFDNNDVLHAMFTTRGLWESPWDLENAVSDFTDASLIWHWREDTDSLNVVAYGWWRCADENNFGDSGSWHSTIGHPSMGIDDDGNIYCVYQQFADGLNPETIDISQGGFANGDVMLTVSTDGGYNWAEPTNITNTRTNGMPAGECQSEIFPCMTEEVGDSVHIRYMEDRDAGSVPFSEGVATENPMWYVAIPTSDIPTTPLVEQFYFHVRPVPREPYSSVETYNDLTPVDFTFDGNYPNPFNPSTNFNFSLERDMDITMSVYDVQGRLITKLADGEFASGRHSIKWDASNAGSGIYFCKLTAEGNTKTIKALLMK